MESGSFSMSPSPDQDRVMSATAIGGFSRPGGPGGFGGSHEGDAQDDWMPTLKELWLLLDGKFPGRMKKLRERLMGSIDKGNLESTVNDVPANKNTDSDNDDGDKMDIDSDIEKNTVGEGSSSKGKAKAAPEPRRSLLKEVEGASAEYRCIMRALDERAKSAYTETVTPVFLLELSSESRITGSQSGHFVPTYVNIGTIDVDENKGESTEQSTSTKYSLENTQALDLALLFNELLGTTFSASLDEQRMDAYTLPTDVASDESDVGHMFRRTRITFDDIFAVFKKLGLEVTARGKGRIGGHSFPTGGQSDLSVRVFGENQDRNGVKTKVSEFPVIIEFKKPNAGFWVGWTLLTGHTWTEEQKKAFWELKTVPRSAYKIEHLKDWENAKMWDSMEEVLRKVPPDRVRAAYSRKPANIDNKSVRSKRSGATGNADTPDRSYFIEETEEDITSLLEDARVKVCVKNCLGTVGQVSLYARGNNCDNIAIADGLTFIGGTVKSVVQSKGATNPHGREDVLDVNFHSTFMMQTHDKNSSWSVLNYLSNNSMTSRLLCGGYSFFLLVDKLYPDGTNNKITAELQEKLNKEVANQGPLVFDSRRHCLATPAFNASVQPESKRHRAAIEQTLGEVKLAKSPDHFTSGDFIICEWFREDVYDGASSSGPSSGRSKSVARVQRRSESDRKNYVLKEYYGDADSMARAKLELDAYELIAKLDASDKKHVAELVAFGSLDLDGTNPRLCLLLEYVEEPENAPTDNAALLRELYYVNSALKSVGVTHNDLEDRNYKWQQDADGSWYIKVFDFDHANLHEPIKTTKLPDISFDANHTMFNSASDISPNVLVSSH